MRGVSTLWGILSLLILRWAGLSFRHCPTRSRGRPNPGGERIVVNWDEWPKKWRSDFPKHVPKYGSPQQIHQIRYTVQLTSPCGRNHPFFAFFSWKQEITFAGRNPLNIVLQTPTEMRGAQLCHGGKHQHLANWHFLQAYPPEFRRARIIFCHADGKALPRGKAPFRSVSFTHLNIKNELTPTI